MEKLLVVSGGTRGIGKAIVQRFAKENFNIVTCSRNEQELLNLKKEISDSFGIKILTFNADLSRKAEVSDFVQFVNEVKSEIDVLVNNTGLFIPGQIHKEEDGVLEQMIETNLYSSYNLSRGVLPKMIKRRKGHIFNICSTASITPYINGGSYCISKYAMYGMSKVLREEMKEHNIKVTSILPGATFTSSWEGVNLPSERFMKPEDVAELVFAAYHLSDSAVVEDILVRPMLGDIS